MNPEDLQLLVTRERTFGKYKGRCIADLPGNYLTWFAREGLLSRFFERRGVFDTLDFLRKQQGAKQVFWVCHLRYQRQGLA